MKATIEAAVARRAMQRAARVAAPKANIPILRNVMITAGKKSIRFAANNLEYSIEIERPAEVETEGMTCILAADFRAFCDLVPDGGQIVIETEDTILKARCGTRRASFSTLPGADFPKPMDPVKAWPGSASDLAGAIRFAMPAASREDTRYYLCGVCLSDGHAVATDGHVLHVAPCKTAATCILPNDHLPMMLDVMEEDGAKFGATENRWMATAKGVSLIGKCVDGTFPDWRLVVPEFEPVATCHRDGVSEALDAATLKGNGAVVISSDGGDLVSIDATRELGDGHAEIDAVDVTEFRAPLDAKLIRSSLGVLPAADCEMAASPNLAFRLRGSGSDDGRFCLIMQMRG